MFCIFFDCSEAVMPRITNDGPTLSNGTFKTSQTNVAAGFWGDCLRFAVGATITIAIVTLDFITDWLMYRNIQELDIPKLIDDIKGPQNGTSKEVVLRYKEFYELLPLIFFGVCIAAAVSYAMYFLWYCYMFRAERNYLKDKWDGVTRKGYFCHKYGGEVVLFVHVLLQDLLISGLLFAVQVAVSCHFQVALDHVIYELALGTTLLSIAWKFSQLIWNSGCLGQREEYESGAAVNVLRCATLLVLVCASSLAIWNAILLVGWKYNDYIGPSVQNTIMDKIEVDRWRHQDGIALVYFDPMTGEATPVIMDVIPMDYVMHHHNQTLYATRPCISGQVNLTTFLESPHQTREADNCTVTFEFIPILTQGYILYDYVYSFTSDGTCQTGQLQAFRQQEMAINTLVALETPAPPTMATTTDTAIPNTTNTHNALMSNATISNYLSRIDQLPFHSVLLLSSLWASDDFVCGFSLLPRTLLSQSEVCKR